MPLKDVFVIARNSYGRACLQHKLVDGQAERTACGRDISGWSRQLMTKRLDAILCLAKACRS
jgi:hypothetical protein